MASVLRMPAVLANSTEAILQTWLVQVGEPFQLGDELAEIETEKAIVELAADEPGIMGRHLIGSGTAVEVGLPIAVIISEGETADDIETVLQSSGVQKQRGDSASPPEIAVISRESIDPAATEPPHHQRLFVSPLVRRLARDGNVDPSAITGTGPNGRIVRRDLDSWLANTSGRIEPTTPHGPYGSKPRTSAATQSDFEDVPHTAMRRAIARRLAESKSSVPHFYVTTDCRVDRLLDMRAEINNASETKISVNDMIVKAAAAAFAKVPEANVIWTDAALRRFHRVDISVAISTDKGLLTPVVRDVGSLSLSAVSATIGELAGRARAGRLRQEELEGGSFSVSNLGMYGTKEFTAILNPPHSGILAVGAAQQQVIVSDGEIEIATVMRCTLSADHRAIDGALAARWLEAFTTLIEHPAAILV